MQGVAESGWAEGGEVSDRTCPLLTTDPCLNGGLCQDSVGSFSCSCLPGFAGPRCARDVDECLSSPCGPGTCTDHVASFTCACPPGYGGLRCEQDLPDCSPRWVRPAWELRDPGMVCSMKKWGPEVLEGDLQLGTCLRTLRPGGAVPGKGQGTCLQVTLAILVPEEVRPGPGGVSTW